MTALSLDDATEAWPYPRLKRLVAAWNGGATLTVLAEEEGTTRGSISGVLSRLRRRGVTVRVNPKKVPKVGRPKRPLKTDAQRAEAERLYLAGLPFNQIAEKVGTSYEAVRTYLNRLIWEGRLPERARNAAVRRSRANDARRRGREAGSPERQSPTKTNLDNPPRSPDEAPVTLFDRRENQCCFPVTGPSAPVTLYCGAPRGPKTGRLWQRAYCPYHRRVMSDRPAAPVLEAAE